MKTLKLVKKIKNLKEEIHQAKRDNKTIGFIPTMGYLHEGHLSLVREAQKECDFIVVSIFVNPIQFNSEEDLKNYPRDLERDLRLLQQENVDLVFAPELEEIYPTKPTITLDIPSLTNKLCGLYRPGHFQGVLLVVLKLFHLVEPNKAYFGKKDYQQYRIIQKMVEELNLDIEIVGCPLVREESGLAMSSRNVRLSEKSYNDAVLISRALRIAKNEWMKGETQPNVLKEIIKDIIETGSLNRVEYVEIVDPITLESVEKVRENDLIAVAVYTENVRLIDNIELKKD
ncbi:MAG: pantoate--beta-alanine ligase [Leptospiraceae bacterium]|nr:pantoate--beta-alanine ligase [Leptospiraceae bacterium]MDW7975347.1 pantoate--beta-alanine ligase [Leptospiraceae bacterium]